MMVFARVDLPEPLGPIRACTSPRDTLRSTPLRISLPSTVTCRFWISRSAMSNLIYAFLWSDRSHLERLGGLACPARARPLRMPRARAPLRERDELGERRLLERPVDAALDAGPEQLRRAALVGVELVVAQDPVRHRVRKALHRGERALERLHDLRHRDPLGRARELVAAMGAALRGDELGLPQPGD